MSASIPSQASHPTLDSEASAGGLFIRNSSGLVRDIGLSGALGLNLGLLNIGAAIGFFTLMFALFPKANVFWALLIGGVGTGTLAWVYSQLGTAMPRSGGDYVFQARVFHPLMGSWVGIALLLYTWFLTASSVVFYASNFVPFVFSTLGDALGWGLFVTIGSDTTTQTGTFVAAICIFGVSLLFCLGGVKMASRAAYWFVLVGMVGVIMLVGELLFHSRLGFEHAYNQVSGHASAYTGVVAQARARGWTPGLTFSGTIIAIPYGFLMFGSFWWSVYTGGEVKHASKTQFRAMLISIVAAVAFVVLAWVAMRGAAGGGFIQAGAWLGSNAPDALSKLSSVAVTPQAFAVVGAGSVVKVIIALGLFAWMFPGTIGLLLGLSRMLFAFSFDRLLPEWVATVSGRRRNPIVAMGITVVASVPLIALVIYDTGIANAYRNIIVLGAAIAFMACLAVSALPYRRRDLYDASPKIVAARVFGVPAISLIGTVSGLFCAWVTVLTLTKGQYSGGFNTASTISLVVMAFAGVVVYAISRLARSRQGIDINLAMHELPPD